MAGLGLSILNLHPSHFARNISDEEVTMESFPASSFATLKQILDISGFKLWPIDWLRGGGGVGGGGGGDLGGGRSVNAL